MHRFIEIHVKGEKHLINLDWVEDIAENKAGEVTIYFAFSVPDAIGQDYLVVDEDWYTILEKVVWVGADNE